MTHGAPGWRTSLVVEGVYLNGQRAPVVVGLLQTAAGDVQLAIRVGEHGEPVILTLQGASQHITHVRELLLERLRLTGEVLGGDET